ncbi:hypothetical protein IW261DRAFT_1426758 [Armillaria novae-zelandiae]|uniref:Uncharacterized protein n=1 Tax=Armillaria novae-zelandiae TaxID=153914 RepID=A0AA39TYA2_9AGAR|nr:hypothetical protein IW261DRAFT_1426758 [Armillaria novae-zelandiae]
MVSPQAHQPIRSSTVTHLTLTWIPTGPSDSSMDLALEHSYSTLTNLRYLTVKYWPNMNRFLGTLCIRPGNVIFPKMSELGVFSSFDHSRLDMHILVELIQSRRDQGDLREFNITWQWGVINYDADTRRQWQQLCAPGGGIQISASIKGGVREKTYSSLSKSFMSCPTQSQFSYSAIFGCPHRSIHGLRTREGYFGRYWEHISLYLKYRSHSAECRVKNKTAKDAHSRRETHYRAGEYAVEYHSFNFTVEARRIMGRLTCLMDEGAYGKLRSARRAKHRSNTRG